MPSEKVKGTGMVERIGLEDAQLLFTFGEKDHQEKIDAPDHKAALEAIARHLMHPTYGIITNASDIATVGHRVVHGGATFSQTTEATPEVQKEIENLASLAPLHNPANLEGIRVASQIFSSAKQVAVFDTAFHQTMPDYAYEYAIPRIMAQKHGIRVYGFHGTSHKYVSEKAIAYLGSCDRLVAIHLGNGCSITAIKNGKSIDTSLGFGPLTGLVMGTRSGDIDPLVLSYMQEQMGLSASEAITTLQKKSGLLGLTGFSDLRDVQKGAEEGDANCLLALKMSAYRIKKYIGGYAAAMNGLEAIVFTAGIGENSALLREMVCEDMTYLGIELDKKKNALRSKEVRDIQAAEAKVNILVVPTNEELEIAKQSYELMNMPV